MTTTEQFDWSKLPPSTHGDDVWFSVMLLYQIDRLKRLYGAICKWREVVDANFDEFKRQCEQTRNPAWDEYGYDPIQDEAFMLLETERVLFANLGVSIASVAENFIIGICKMRDVKCVNDSGDTHFGIACKSLGDSLKTVISDLPGFGGNQRARMLGNCFKHSEGKTNQRFVKRYGGTIEETLDYENEKWLSMIADTETLLSEIIQRLKPEQMSS